MPKLVAIVEDDSASLAALASLVAAFGYEVRGFADPAAFLASDAPARAGGLVADLRLPGMSGAGLHRHLRRRGIALPTILVTAWPDEASRRHALEAGVAAYLAKPVAPEELLACLRRIME